MNDTRSIEQEHEERFAWRKSRQIANLQELTEAAQSGGADALRTLPGLPFASVNDDPKDALGHSILMLWCEAAECYVFGLFQSCILVCGAIVERSLKLEYEKAKGALPPNSRWTLGVCIKECQDVVAAEVLKLANELLGPRNDRAHALLEHSDPGVAIMGGAGRGIEILSHQHYQIEPFRGEAKHTVSLTWQILNTLYGKGQGGQQDAG